MPEIGEIYISIKGKSTDLQKTLDDSKNASAKAGQAAATAYAERFQATMKSVGSAMSASITAPLLGIGIAASKLSMDFGDAMAKVEGAAGAGHAEVVKLRDAVLDLGGATGKAPKELADALYYIESKSFRGAKAMEILGSSAKLSATGLGSVADIARTIGFAMKAYGENNLSAARAADIFAAAVREGSMPADSLAGALGRILPEASRLGVGFDQLTGSLSVMTRIGLNVDEAVTSLRQTFLTMDHPSKQTQKALASVGLTAEEVARSLKTDLIGTLQVLAKASEKGGETFQRIFPNVRAFTGVLALTGKMAGEARTTIDHVTHSLGAADEMFKIASKTAGGQWRMAMADINAAGIQLGDTLAPNILALSKEIKGLSDWFRKLNDSQKETVIKLGALAAADGPVILVTIKLAQAYQSIIALRTAFIASQVAMSTSMGGSAISANLLSASLYRVGFMAGGAMVRIGALTTSVMGFLASVPLMVGAMALLPSSTGGAFGATAQRHGAADMAIGHDSSYLEKIEKTQGMDAAIKLYRQMGGNASGSLGSEGSSPYTVEFQQRAAAYLQAKNISEASKTIQPKTDLALGDAIDDPTKKAKVKKEADDLSREMLQAMAKSISTPAGEASCAFFASQLLQKTGVQVGKIGGAKALIDDLLGHGGQRVSSKEARAGDLVYYYGKQYGSDEAKDDKGNGYHVGVYAGDGYVVDKSGKKTRMNNTVHRGANFVRPARSGKFDNMGDLAMMASDTWEDTKKAMAEEAQRIVDSLEPIRKIQNAHKADKLKAAGGMLFDVIAMREFGKNFLDLTDEANKNKVRGMAMGEADQQNAKNTVSQVAGWFGNSGSIKDIKAYDENNDKVKAYTDELQKQLDKEQKLSQVGLAMLEIRRRGLKVTGDQFEAILKLAQAKDDDLKADKAKEEQDKKMKVLEERRTEGLKQYSEAMRSLGDRTTELGRSSEVNEYRLKKFALSFAGGSEELSNSAEIMKKAKDYMAELANVEDLERLKQLFNGVADSMVTPIKNALGNLIRIDMPNFFRSLGSIIDNALRDIATKVIEYQIRLQLNNFLGSLFGTLFMGGAGAMSAGVGAAVSGIGAGASGATGGIATSNMSQRSSQAAQGAGQNVFITINASDAGSVIASKDQVAMAMANAAETARRKF